MEIGSIYEIAPSSVRGCGSGSRSAFAIRGLDGVKKYNKRYCAYTASGREAIALALRSLERNRQELCKTCLLPAYMCDTVFFPFEREGWEIHFYHVNKELAVSEDELRYRIEQVRPSLLFIHPYYGVDTWKPLRPFLKKLKEQGLCIMEDVTQSYYLSGVGEEADYVVGSLRKWYPVPDGGFVVSDEKLIEEEIEEAREHAGMRLRTLMDKWEYLHGEGSAEDKKICKSEYLKRNRELEEQLDAYPGIRGMSDETAYILERIDEEDAKQRRSDNYAYLYDRLRNKNGLVPILPMSCDDGGCPEDRIYPGDGRCPEDSMYPERSIYPENSQSACYDVHCGGAAPLYLAVYADKRDELQAFLTGKDIYAPVLWPIGKENHACLTEDERYIYEHMLALPIDQRYGRGEMQRIEQMLMAFESNIAG